MVLCGDMSWGMSLEEAEADFAFLDALPGPKAAAQGQPRLLVEHRGQDEPLFCRSTALTSLHILHNNCYVYGDIALCGTRGWFYEEDRRATTRRCSSGS